MRRILLFLLLLAAGFFVLRWAVGDDPVATAGDNGGSKPRPNAPSIQMQRRGGGVAAQISGPMSFAQKRPVPDGAGVRLETVYEFSCADSEPLPDGSYLLTDVVVRLFDRGAPAATLTAQQATAELRVADGQRTIRDDKEIELREVVLESLPGARMGSLRIEVGVVRAEVTDEIVFLHTPTDRETVTVTVGGARPGTLRGRGLQARMPKDRGLVPDGADSGRLELVIQREPEVLTEGMQLRAQGSLRYIEDLRSGAALLTIDRDVRLHLDAAAGAARRSSGPMQVRGDLLTGVLQRSRSAAGRDLVDDGLLWTQLRLVGSPAVVLGDGIDLKSPRLTVVPGPGGDPAIVTAHGGQSELRQTGPEGATFTSSRPIRLVRGDQALAAPLQLLGFPGFALRPLADLEVLTFEGDAHLEGQDGVRVTADRGLHVFRFGSGEQSVLARGFGNVAMAKGDGAEGMIAIGDNGFFLRRSTVADVLVLGVEQGAAIAQRFELRRGSLELTGTGSCQLERRIDGTVLRVDCDSQPANIVANLGAELGSLQGAQTLHFAARNGELSEFSCTGAETHLVLERKNGERLDAWAERVEQTAANAWSLYGVDQPARLRRPAVGKQPAADLLAPRIDVHRLGARAVLVEAVAQGTVLARLQSTLPTGKPGAADRAPASADLGARRIRLLPFGVPRPVLAMHLAGLPPGLAAVLVRNLDQAWVVATDAVVAEITDPVEGRATGSGESLLLSIGAQSLLFTGDADSATPATLRNVLPDGRIVVAKGARVRFDRHERGRLTVLTTFPGRSVMLPPSVSFHDPRGGSANDPFANLRAECNGEIDVTDEAVLFRGPVVGNGLLPDGNIDPKGLRVVAQKLTLARADKGGEVVRAEANDGVTVDWQGLHAVSARCVLDLRRRRCTVDDPVAARLEFGNGLTYRARRIEANYSSYEVSTWFGRLSQDEAVGLQR